MTEKQETTYSMEQRAKLWAVGGGKGGVGKSFLTTNIGVLLAKEGKRVVLMDLDLGGANLHTCLGVTDLDRGVSDFLMRRYEELEEALVPTQVPNLFLLSGAQDSLNIANPKYAQKIRLLRELKKIEADYILMDLGAGTSFNTLDFFIAADTQLLVAIPEPTSIEMPIVSSKVHSIGRSDFIVKPQSCGIWLKNQWIVTIGTGSALRVNCCFT